MGSSRAAPQGAALLLDTRAHGMDTINAAPSGAPVYEERDRLVLLTPCYGHMASVHFRNAVTLAQSYPTARFRCADGKVRSLPIMAGALDQPGDSHIDRARNTALWHFMQKPYRFGLWMDGDQPFEPEHVARIWSHLMSGKRVVGGLVALKSIVPTFVCNATRGQQPDPQTGLIEPDDVGTGCLGFNRDVVDEIVARWPAYVRNRLSDALGLDVIDHHKILRAVQALAECGYSADLAYNASSNTPMAGQVMHAIFRSGVAHRDGDREWLSEDWMFCHMCRLLGIPIHADTQVNIKHIGPMSFPPEPEEIVEAALKVCSGRQPPFSKPKAEAAATALRALHEDIRDDSITVLHATRGRALQARLVREQFISTAFDPARVEYLFAVDEDDEASRTALAEFNPVVVPPSGGIVAAINAAAAQATGRILVMAADDCVAPQHWDREVRLALKGQLHLPRLLWTSDGYSDQPVAIHPIITRALYERQGWFFCPEYQHLFCDTELSERARLAGEVVDGRHLVFHHEHPMWTQAKPDALHTERNSRAAWQAGLAVFQRRNPTSQHPHARA